MAESGLTNRGSLRQKDPSCVLPSVITELLKDQNLLPEPPRALDDIVLAFSEAEQIAAAQLATELRAEGGLSS